MRPIVLFTTVSRCRSCSVLATLAVLGASACAVDPAPTEVTDPIQWFWRNYSTATDAEAADVLKKLNGQLSAVTADAPMKSTISRLAKADVSALKVQGDPDPAHAVGLLAVTEFACKLDKLAEVITATDQDKKYPGSYTSYQRKHTTVHADWLAKKATLVAWDTDLTADTVGSPSESLSGGARRVADLGKEKSPFGSFVVSRTWLKKPATFDDPDNTWPQDWQIEVYYERTPGRMVHLFGAWRQMKVSVLSTDDDSLQKLMLSNFVKWDAQTEKLCAQ